MAIRSTGSFLVQSGMSAPPAPSNTVRIEADGDLTLVLVRPALVEADWAAAEHAADEVTRHFESVETPHCVVDLTELNYLGSTQVAFIVRVWKAIREARGGLAVACPNTVVHEVLTLAGLDKLFSISLSREEALAVLRPQKQSSGRSVEWVLGVLAILGTAASLVGAWDGLFRGIDAGLLGWTSVVGALLAVICGGCLAMVGRGWWRWLGLLLAILTAVASLASLRKRGPPPAPRKVMTFQTGTSGSAADGPHVFSAAPDFRS
ncbi:MAG: STAS domain-containing protein [Planctomycetaceae bacterium]